MFSLKTNGERWTFVSRVSSSTRARLATIDINTVFCYTYGGAWPIKTKESKDVAKVMNACGYVRRLPDGALDATIAVPLLAVDLLAHAAGCSECSKRISVINSRHFTSLSPEEKQACEETSREIVSSLRLTLLSK